MPRAASRLRGPERPYGVWSRGTTWRALGWLAALGALGLGLSRLEPHVRRLAAPPARLVWVNLPAWLEHPHWKHVLRELEEQIGLHPQTDLFDPAVCAYVASQASRSAWVDSVRRVTKHADGTVRIEAEFRKPFTYVEYRGRAYLIDEYGVRLPPDSPAEFVDRQDWLPVSGVAYAPPPVGQRWPGEDLAAGLKLVKFLYAVEVSGPPPFRASLRSVDVSNHNYRQRPSDGWLRLITRNPRSYIHWGLPPGEEYGIESTAEMKLAALTELCLRRGGLPEDGPIDIRAEDRILIGEPH